MIDRHFFQPLPVLGWGMFRFLYCSTVLVASLVRFSDYGRWLDAGVIHSTHSYYTAVFAGWPVWVWCRAIFWTALFFAAAGKWTRPALAVALLALFPLAMPIHPPLFDTNGIFFVLLLLLFSPGVEEFGWDRRRQPAVERNVPSWAREAIIVYLSSVYFGAALNKLVHRGDWQWLNGRTLEVHMYRFSLFSGSEAAGWIARHPSFCAVLATASVVFELSFVSTVFFRRVRPAYAVAGLLMHVSIYLVMKIEFVLLFCPIYLVFLSPPWLAKRAAAVLSFTHARQR